MDWAEKYKELGAYWLHDGNPNRPHVILTSGLHSNGFFNSDAVLEYPRLLDQAAYQLVMRFYGLTGSVLKGESVRAAGPAMGAIKLAHEIADHLGGKASYAEKGQEKDGTKTFSFKRTPPQKGETIILCEDVLTTGGSVAGMVEAVRAHVDEKHIVPYVLVLVNRSGLTEIDGRRIIALIDQPMPQWESSVCPLCAAGSEAIKAKTPPENWERLNADYSEVIV